MDLSIILNYSIKEIIIESNFNEEEKEIFQKNLKNYVDKLIDNEIIQEN